MKLPKFQNVCKKHVRSSCRHACMAWKPNMTPPKQPWNMNTGQFTRTHLEQHGKQGKMIPHCVAFFLFHPIKWPDRVSSMWRGVIDAGANENRTVELSWANIGTETNVSGTAAFMFLFHRNFNDSDHNIPNQLFKPNLHIRRNGRHVTAPSNFSTSKT